MNDTTTNNEPQFDINDMSLADLAGVDVSDIEEVRFEAIPLGTYNLRVNKAEIEDTFNNDGDKVFRPIFEIEIIDVVSILKTPAGEDKEAYAQKQVGRKHSERFTINMAKGNDDIATAIGRVKSFHTDVSQGELPWTANLVENVESLVDREFVGQFTHQTDKNDKSRVFSRLTPAKKK